MAFDEEAELNEPGPHFELVFSSGSPLNKGDLSMPPSAYIAMGWHTSHKNERPMLTTREMSVDTLEAQVREIKARLDACIAEARARFAATGG
jgi:hypothetical protein